MHLHILVIDDDDAVRNSLLRMLTAHGHTALGASDGSQALALALSHAPDVIILDLHLPKQSGVQIAHTLKQHRSLAEIPIVSLSATPGDANNAALFREVLVKPCSSAALLHAVLNAVQGSAQSRGRTSFDDS